MPFTRYSPHAGTPQTRRRAGRVPGWRYGRLASAGVALLLWTGCALPAAAPSSADTASLSANLQFCADEINRYRTSVGLNPLTRSDELERYAAQAVRNDAGEGVPHRFFSRANGGGVTMAETELLRWRNYSVRAVIERGLASMWAGGASGAHYGVIVGPYTQVGCGVFAKGNEVSVAQEYR